ncbi:ImuA family protein [Pedobacter sp. ASV28]|uniref:ImuA family protein n=1 Tax=Pedobacter sp. ASV28 TaxID=2795123 RepID=UPI0018ECB6A1|nr:Error-prone repair protein ImuA [Pedobacter sp. ASV28]
MESRIEKIELVRRLQKEIDALQGLGKSIGRTAEGGFQPFESAFPDHTFPTGTVHEFISYESGEAASTNGFIAAIAGKLMVREGICLWIGAGRKLFPPAVKNFGIDPERIVFLDLHRQKDILWCIEESLKCEALTAVVAEIREVDFSQSRRLMLAVERSGVSGFIHRHQPLKENTIACTTRWRISPLSTVSSEGLPGIGYPRWDVQLLKVRNGKPSAWQIEWSEGNFEQFDNKLFSLPSTFEERKIV